MLLASLVSTFASSAAARTVFSAVSVDGQYQGQGVGVRVPSSNAPVTDISSSSIICNTGVSQPSDVIQVSAGKQVTAHFHHLPTGYAGPDPSDPLDPTNKGPIIAYLAAITSATQSSVSGLKWFKIWQDGYDGIRWGSDHLFTNGGNATFTIPSCIAAGDYLLRVEAIDLLTATSYPGAQFFMSCAQLSVSSSGSAKQPTTVSFPGAYTCM
ncbi:putative endo-beta-1,4-glucanase D [Leucoagaricus sp. SymC.cos]|nr:putative endo-beta-1,4-glucanase D [Leucoagaricus sp. SymC.cos]